MKIALLAAVPVLELRAAIPYGVAKGLTPQASFLFAYMGSMLPVPFLLLLIKPLFLWLAKNRHGKIVVDKLRLRSLSKSDKVRRYGVFGLVLFVSIPLPGTGVWTGAMIAAFLDIRFKKAFPAIAIGNLIAGSIMMIISYGVLEVF